MQQAAVLQTREKIVQGEGRAKLVLTMPDDRQSRAESPEGFPQHTNGKYRKAKIHIIREV